MNIYRTEILKRNLEFILFISISVMFLINIALHIKTLRYQKEPTLIAIDNNGTRIIRDLDDPIYKTEATVFIKSFITNLYNFNPENFMQRVGLTTSQMSEELWKAKRSEIMDLKSKVERDEITLTTEIQKLTKDSENKYYGLINVTERTRMNTQKHQIEIILTLNKTDRSATNPTGLEVATYEENPIRN